MLAAFIILGITICDIKVNILKKNRESNFNLNVCYLIDLSNLIIVYKNLKQCFYKMNSLEYLNWL